ncbi:MAG: branched-chain amino acid ABC transporter permease [Candidatus Bathyarchaeia archaeon]|nr:branched-chain amino acid ABC transporter permease [Candidatus Bathyarchaeota archaeon]
MPRELINTTWYTCLYSLMAVPLTLSYRTSKVLNFAHGIYITIGAYIPVFISRGLGISVSPIIAILSSFTAGAILAMVSHLAVFSPLIKRKATPVTLMIASMGLWIFIKYALYAALSILQRSWMTQLTYTNPNIDIPSSISFMGIEINARLLLTILLVIVVFTLLTLFLMKTKTGMAIRAIADNPELAQLTGISREKTLLIAWAISGGIAAIGGFAWSIFAYVSPETGDNLILQVFACSVIGGLVSLSITFIGAIIISSAENLLIILLNRYFGVELSFRPFLSFLILLLTILIRPPAGAGGGLPYRYKITGYISRLLRRREENV